MERASEIPKKNSDTNGKDIGARFQLTFVIGALFQLTFVYLSA